MLSSIVDDTLLGIYVIQDYKVVDANNICLNMFGYTLHEMKQLEVLHLIKEEDQELVQKDIEKRLYQGIEHAHYRTIAVKKDGTNFLAEIHGVGTTILNNKSALIGTIIDVSEREKEMVELSKQQLMLQQSEEKLQALIKNSNDVIGILTIDGVIEYVNPTIKKVLGFEAKDIINTNLYRYVHPDDSSNIQNIFKRLLEQPNIPIRFETRVRKLNGTWCYVEAVLNNHLQNPHLKAITFNYRDITERKLFIEKIKKMAYFDYLTGLPNRRQFEDKLNNEIHQANKDTNKLFAIMFLDLDDFKQINDVFGHQFGDLLLKDFSNRFNNYHIPNTCLSRFGGDKFALLLSNIDSIEDIYIVVDEIMKMLEKPFIINDYEFFISTSIGISIYPHAGMDIKTLLKNADIAIYKAKDNGKKTYEIYSSVMDEDTYRRFKLKNDLKKAVLDQECLIYYQPKVEPSNNRIIGAEALIRWKHPEWGIISPTEFIPLAEEIGMIINIGEWVLRKVCYQLKKWKEEGFQTKISINISVIQLLQANIIEMITQIITEYDINPESIELEITEGVIIQNEEKIARILNQLHEVGFSIALDDFGTGYSAINYLKKYNIDTLKIDKSLIQQIDVDIDSFEITNAIMNLAHKLNISVVAEGVETTGQLSLLKNMACDQIQGYLYSKPVPSDDFKKMFEDEISEVIQCYG